MRRSFQPVATRSFARAPAGNPPIGDGEHARGRRDGEATGPVLETARARPATADRLRANGLARPGGPRGDGWRRAWAGCAHQARQEDRHRQSDRLRPADPEAFVASLDAKRRDLTASTRAYAAAMTWTAAEADGRVQTKGGDRKSKPNNSALIANPENSLRQAVRVDSASQRAQRASSTSCSLRARLSCAACSRSASSKCDTAL